MITLKRLNSKRFVLNCDMIGPVTENPDTTILLTNGEHLTVSGTREEVVDKVAAFRRRTFGELLDQAKKQYTHQTQEEEEKDVIVTDIMSVLGLILVVTLVILGMVFDQEAMQVTFSNIRAFLDYLSMAIMVGDTIGIIMLSSPSKSFEKVGEHLKIIFHPRKYEPKQSIDRTVELAIEVRMKGPPSLEDKPAEVDGPFLYNDLILIVDSMDSEKVRQVMETELEQLDKRRAPDYALYKKAAIYSPAFGMIGTLVGLTLMLGNMSGVDVLAKGIATVLITTLYGSLIANVICLSVISKLKAGYDEEFLRKQLVTEGVLAIQEGENPRLIGERLSKLLPATFMKQKTDTEAEERKGLFGRNKNYVK